MHLLGISGSLRQGSTNSRLLAAAANLVPPGVTMRVSALVGTLPLFTPDLTPAGQPDVERWIDEVREADGVVVSTPEYAGGYPGALKNAFDWLVGSPDAWVRKPFMLLSASARSTLARDSLVTVLETMSGVHLADASATIPLLGTSLDVAAIIGNDEFAGTIRRSLARFAADVEARTS